METIPGRVLRLGQEFDFVIAIDHPTPEPEREIVGRLIKEELQVSQDLGDMLSGEKKVNVLSRSLRSHFA
jgi:hypothetical protein